MAELPAVVEALTGTKLEELSKRIPALQGDPSGAPIAETDGDAEDIG
jgi:hypothetical protein